eukprot:gene19844-21786_t
MGLFLDKPKREKVLDSGEGNGLRFAVSAMQGWRVDMEDSHSMKVNLAPRLSDCSYFAVFDGHAGDFVSKYAAENLFDVILSNLEGKSSYQIEEAKPSTPAVDETCQASKTSSDTSQNTPENKTEEAISITSGSHNSITANEKQNSAIAPVVGAETEQKLRNNTDMKHLATDLDYFKTCTRRGFLELDKQLTELPRFKLGDERSGSTAVAVFVTATHIIFANCGDSRALLSRSGGQVAFATMDHKPYNELEKQRIEKAGGSVIIQRVNGSLAVSRALGDFDYKSVPGFPCTEQLVSAEPELTCIERHPEDEFLVLACDGIWDVMSNQEVIDYVRYRLSINEDLTTLCGDILETSLAKGSKDNMSVIVVAFPGAPKVSEEEQASEKVLNALLKEKIAGFMKKSSEPKNVDTSVVVDFLQDEEISNLPPGGGLSAKMNVIEDILDELVPDRTKDEGPQMGASIPVPLNMMRQFAASGLPNDEGTAPVMPDKMDEN